MQETETPAAAFEGDIIAGPTISYVSQTVAQTASKARPRPTRRRKPTKVTTRLESEVAAMAGAGISQRKIAKALDLAKSTVIDISLRPDVQKQIAEVREGIRKTTIDRISGVQSQAFDFLDEVVAQRDPKAFDAVSRGLAQLERISSSASGEARRVEVKDTTPAATGEAVELVAAFLGIDVTETRVQFSGVPETDA